MLFVQKMEKQENVKHSWKVKFFMNTKEIAKNLPFTLKTTSDTEVLIQAYVYYGNDFVNHLNGMFAIAIYDIEANEHKRISFRLPV